MKYLRVTPAKMRWLLTSIVVSVAYAIAAQVGFLFAIKGNVTAIWFPSGIALAAVILAGSDALPGIFLGSFYGNITAFYSPEKAPVAILVSTAIAIGAALEAYLGAQILEGRIANKQFPFRTTNEVLTFVVFSAFASCLINATIGAISVTIGGFATASNFAITWITWWLGDATGVAIFTPLILVWRQLPTITVKRWVEVAVLIVICVVVLGIAIYTGYPVEYTLIPLLIIVVFRFSYHGATAAVFLVSVILIVGVSHGWGTLHRPNLNESLLMLQVFISTMSLMALILAATLAERRAAERRTEQRVVERTAELESAIEELKAFNYSISHDLRTPLRAMNGLSQILLEDYSSQLPTEAQSHLNNIAQNARQMGLLIDALLSFSRSNRQAIIKQPIQMKQLVSDVYDSLHSEWEGRQIEFIIDDLPPCEGEPALIRQVIVNLLSNALKFTRPRLVAQIHVGYDRSNNKEAYYIQDNGVGFDMRYVDKLFSIFQRLHHPDEFEGIGIGLAIIRGIVERHGGSIWADAAMGKGATFFFTLPHN